VVELMNDRTWDQLERRPAAVGMELARLSLADEELRDHDDVLDRARQRVEDAMDGGGRPPQRIAGELVRRRQRPLPEETR
jgi:hypothetical protein